MLQVTTLGDATGESLNLGLEGSRRHRAVRGSCKNRTSTTGAGARAAEAACTSKNYRRRAAQNTRFGLAVLAP
jgi:hypothetical protein